MILKVQRTSMSFSLIWGFGGCWRLITEVWVFDLDWDMVTGLWYTQDPIFGSLSWFWRGKDYFCLLSPDMGLWRVLEVPDWDWHLALAMVTAGLWYTNDPIFGSVSWFWRWKEHPCSLSPDLGLLRTLEVPDWGLATETWFGYGHWSLVHPYAKFWLSILILKVQRSSMSFKSSFVDLGDSGGLACWSWFG